MTFPERLKELILEKGMDAKAFVTDFKSKDMGVSVSNSTMSNLLRGKTECNYSTIIAFSRYFNVSSDYLLGLSDVKTPDFNLKEASYRFKLDPNIMSKYVEMLDDTNEKQKKWTDLAVYALNFLLYDEMNNHHVNGKNQNSSLLESIGSKMVMSQEEAENPGSFIESLEKLTHDKFNMTFHEYMRAVCSSITESFVYLDKNETFKEFCQQWENFKKDYAAHGMLAAFKGKKHLEN